MTARLTIVALMAWFTAEVNASDPPGDKRGDGAPAAEVSEIVEPIALTLDSAIQRSVALLETSSTTYTEKRECFSCHHQTLPAVTLSLAKQRGYAVGADRMAAQADFPLKYFGARAERLKKGDGVPGGPFTAGYALVGLRAVARKADETTAALVTYLFKTQEKNGQWRIRTHRPPLEDSHLTATALAVRGIELYAAKEQADEVSRRVADARRWLVASLDTADGRDPEPTKQAAASENPTKKPTTKPLTNEDRTFRLLGLHWSGAEKAAIKTAADELLAQQRSDGGWAQTADMTSDAYATGQALVALHETGVLAADHAAYRRGLEYLRKTRLDDGSWLVTTRSKAIQTYFESGFPHGKSQFISICATSWATQALLLPEN